MAIAMHISHVSDIRSMDVMVRPPVPWVDSVPYRVHVVTTSVIAAITPMVMLPRCSRPPQTTGEIGRSPDPRYFATFPGIKFGVSDDQSEHNDIYLTTFVVIAERSRFVLSACTTK